MSERTRMLLAFDIKHPPQYNITLKSFGLFYQELIECFQENVKNVQAPNQYPPDYVTVMERVIPADLKIETLRDKETLQDNEYKQLIAWLAKDDELCKQMLSRPGFHEPLRGKLYSLTF